MSDNTSQDELTILGVEWTEIAKTAILNVVEEIPEVGHIIGIILDLFWPSNKPSVWEQVKEQVENMIDEKIRDHKITERHEKIGAIKINMHQYQEAQGEEKGNFMTNLLVELTELYTMLTDFERDSDTIHYIPYAVNASILHMTILRERVMRGAEFYGVDNSQVWEKELNSWYDKYTQHFQTAYLKWVEWRSEKITANSWTNWPTAVKAEVKDSITGWNFHHETNATDNDKFLPVFSQGAADVKSLWLNVFKARKATEIRPAFYLNQFLKGQTKAAPIAIPALQTLTLGPYSGWTMGWTNDVDPVHWNVSDKDGHQVALFLVRDHGAASHENFIEGMRIYYNDDETKARRLGSWIGNSNYGDYHEVYHGGAQRYFAGMKLWFSGKNGLAYPKFHVCGLEFLTQDKNDSDKKKFSTSALYGRTNGDAKTLAVEGYQMTGGRFKIWPRGDWEGSMRAVELHLAFSG